MVAKKQNKKKLQSKRMPFALVIAEAILALFVLRYCITFLTLSYPAEMPPLRIIATFFSIGWIVFMTILAINAMIGLPSARPQSWRKMMRAVFFILLTIILSTIGESIGLIFDSTTFPLETNLLMFIITFFIMLLPSVRRYYTPPMYDVPPISKWFMYAMWWPLIGAESYRLKYADELPIPNKIDEELDL